MFLFRGNKHELMLKLPQLETIAELGVLKGRNAKFLFEKLKPKKLELIDSWSSEALVKGYSQFDSLPEGVMSLSEFEFYFDGDPSDQKTLDRIYNGVVEYFNDIPNVSIIRENTHAAAKHYDDGYFDMVYIDANHQFEYVLLDLKIWEKKLSNNGFIVLNDCVSSPEARKQNIGVLEAVSSFLKSHNFVPVCLTLTDFSDLIISRKDNPRLASLRQNLIESERCLEVPDQLIYSYNVKRIGEYEYFSFC
jgi:hypothetical protein